MPQRVFDLAHIPDFSAYRSVFSSRLLQVACVSLGMASWRPRSSHPVLAAAYGMPSLRTFHSFLTIAVAVTLFVSETSAVRLGGDADEGACFETATSRS